MLSETSVKRFKQASLSTKGCSQKNLSTPHMFYMQAFKFFSCGPPKGYPSLKLRFEQRSIATQFGFFKRLPGRVNILHKYRDNPKCLWD
jgi:hypothetical protein